MRDDNSHDWLSQTEVAHILGRPTRTVEDWRLRGRGPAFYRFARRVVRYRRDDVEAWIAAHRVEPARGEGIG